MPDLNRTPKNLADADQLIAELRQEILNRPQAVAISIEDPNNDILLAKADGMRISATKIYHIRVTCEPHCWVFKKAMSVLTPQEEVEHTVYETTGGGISIVPTKLRRRLYAVRSDFNDIAGAARHEDIYGYEPTVYRDRTAAQTLCDKLNAEAPTMDWGQNAAPNYSVEEITEWDMWESEELAD